MQLTQRITIPQPSEVIWRALNDPQTLQQSLPACESFTLNEEGGFDLALRMRVGPVSAKFLGEVTLSDIVEGESYTLSGSGKGGVAGFAKGSAFVKIEALDESSTRLEYTAKANVGGKLAQIGSRLIDGAAKKIANDFFTRFVRLLCEDESLEVVLETVNVNKEEGDNKS